jgi:hypothetical protein
MVKAWTSIGFLAVVALLPLGAAEGVADPTPPIVIANVSETLGQNGWHIRDTTVGWTYKDDESGISRTVGCDVNTVRQETAGRSFTCQATNGDGLTVSVTYTVKLDETPPTVRARPTRSPDRNGWFNHRVDFQVTGTDSFSGVQSCNSVPSYTDPDKANIRITGRCRDRAGHRGTGTFLLDYDDTAPTVRAAFGREPDRYGWYARDVRVSFTGRDPVSRVADCSSKVYRGPDTARASVTGWCRDRAGNQRSRTPTFKFSKPLLQPRSGRRVTSAPLLDWVDVSRVLEYNAQVWHEGRKILSRWPDRSRLQLHRGWRFQGEWRKLKAGERYKVYVWPRFRKGYGRLLSRGGFTFVGGSSASPKVVAAAGLEPATHGL